MARLYFNWEPISDVLVREVRKYITNNRVTVPTACEMVADDLRADRIKGVPKGEYALVTANRVYHAYKVYSPKTAPTMRGVTFGSLGRGRSIRGSRNLVSAADGGLDAVEVVKAVKLYRALKDAGLVA